MLKKIIGYLLLVLAAVIVIGNIFTVPSIFEPNGRKGTEAIAYNFGQITALLLMLLAAYFLFKLGRNWTRVQKNEVNNID